MASGQEDDAGNQQQDEARTAPPEEIWLDHIREHYPNLQQETYFFPPLSFNRVSASASRDPPQGPQQNTSSASQAGHQQSTPSASQDPPQGHQQNTSSASQDPPQGHQVQQSTPSASQDPPQGHQQSTHSGSQVPPQGHQQNTSSASKKKKKKKKKVPPSSTSQASGFCIENPEVLQPSLLQECDLKDDQAQQQCLSALRDIPGQPMVVVSQLHFRKYLDNETNPERLTNPLLQTAIQLLPNLGSLPVKLQDGECDILIIHRHYGLILGEMIGSHTQPPDNEAIVKRVEKAVQQLRNQQQALAHLVKDLATPGSIRITRTLMLPNLSDAQLTSALNSSGEVKQELCQTLSNSNDLTQARRHCVCEEDLQQASHWWNDLHGQGPDPCMTSDLFEHLVARFCGPVTTVDIPTACTSGKAVVRTRGQAATETSSHQPSKVVVRSLGQAATETSSPQPPEVVVRSQGQAVAETSLRFSALTLTPSQVALLGEKPAPRYLYLQGPPGTGKTVVLVLKALQWAQRQMKVVIINQPGASAAISMLIERQLTELLGETAAASYIHRHCCDFDDRLNIRADVARLWREHGRGCAILCDEIPRCYFTQWLTEVRNTSPEAVVWMAGVWTRDSTTHPLIQLPPWVEARTLWEPLRSPPVVTKMVQDELKWGVIPYAHPVLMDPPVQPLRHNFMPGHKLYLNPLMCWCCADNVAVILNQLRVGQPGQPLQYRDVWILSNGLFIHGSESVMVEHLREGYGMPIVRIRGNPLGEGDAQELALAITDQIIETDLLLVAGLERKIVISLQPGLQQFSFMSFSRSTSRLICIDHPFFLHTTPPSTP